MKCIFYSVAVFCFVSMISCKEKRSTRPTTVANPQFTLPTGSPAKQTPVNPALPVNNAIVPATGQQTLNPAHGQPGHRCDIAVGAPLPATAQSINTPSTIAAAPNPAIQANSLTVPQTTTAVPPIATGLNPAHGQPGHRCDIAVGEPLNSKPAAKNQPAPVTTGPSVAKPAALPPDTLFAKGLNPAHGQPGHRCDIAVGKPLNEPKKTDTTTTPIPLVKQTEGN